MNQLCQAAVTYFMIGLSFGVTACEPPNRQVDSENKPGLPPQTASDASTCTQTSTCTNPATPVNRPAEFCREIGKLKSFRTNISEELKVFCTGSTPTNDIFVKLYQDAVALDPKKSPEISPSSRPPDIVEGDDGFSTIRLFFSFVGPAKVDKLQGAPLVESLALAYQGQTVIQTAQAFSNSDVDGLHFRSANITYDLKIISDANSDLTNQRKTQFNVYQLDSGNPHLGIAVEHLLEPNNDYRRATMLNIVLSTPDEQNSVIVTMLNYELANRGLHSLAVKSIKEVAINAGSKLYKALSEAK